MYLHRRDEVGKLAVWLFDKASPQEWDTHFEHLEQIAAWPQGRGDRAATVLIAASFDRPNAKQRAELARVTEAPGFDCYVAFVTPNLALRSVLTMLGWVHKAPKYEIGFFANTDEALIWLHGRRNDVRIRLEAMVDAVLEEHRKAGGAR
jgi:hypothetical protein